MGLGMGGTNALAIIANRFSFVPRSFDLSAGVERESSKRAGGVCFLFHRLLSCPGSLSAGFEREISNSAAALLFVCFFLPVGFFCMFDVPAVFYFFPWPACFFVFAGWCLFFPNHGTIQLLRCLRCHLILLQNLPTFSGVYCLKAGTWTRKVSIFRLGVPFNHHLEGLFWMSYYHERGLNDRPLCHNLEEVSTDASPKWSSLEGMTNLSCPARVRNMSGGCAGTQGYPQGIPRYTIRIWSWRPCFPLVVRGTPIGPPQSQ